MRNPNSRAQPKNATVALKVRPQSHRPKLIVACLILEFTVNNAVPLRQHQFYKNSQGEISRHASPSQKSILFLPIDAEVSKQIQVPL